MVNEFKRKLTQLNIMVWLILYNNLMENDLGNDDILMYSTHNEGKSAIAERFIRTLKSKIYKKWQLI